MKKIVFILSCALLVLVCNSSCSHTERNIFATLYGVVSNSETGEPIDKVSVVLAPGGKTATTAADGRYEFADLDPQQYTITVQKNGYQTNRKTIMAMSGEHSEANITLTLTKN